MEVRTGIIQKHPRHFRISCRQRGVDHSVVDDAVDNKIGMRIIRGVSKDGKAKNVIAGDG